jgi:hypothetical protein
MGVASEAGEKSVGGVDFSVDRSESIEKMKSFDRSAGSVGVAFFMREDERGEASAVDDA